MIEVRDLAHTNGDFRLGTLSFSLQAGEYFVVVGPTGAGKTMLLECIVGLHANRTGSVWIEGQDVSSWMPEERNIGYVPQHYALFPFLSVKENILFPLHLRGRPDQSYLSRFREIVDLLRIGHILERNTQGLSGGEQQRVALARALVMGPKLLLLDEPYAALHAGLRRKLWVEMRLVHARLGTTVIHVTHDLEEAFILGERAAVLIEGRIAQVGCKNDILRKPISESVAAFLGMVNIFSGRVTRIVRDQRCMYVQARGCEFALPLRQGLSVGDKVGFCIHADRIRILADEPGAASCCGQNCLSARLVVAASDGTTQTLYFKIQRSSCKCGEYDLEVRLPDAEAVEGELQEGQETMLSIGKGAIHVFGG